MCIFRKSGNRRRSRGQSFVELAILLPLVLLLLAGLVEVGFLMFTYMNALDLTREAARFLSTRDYREAIVTDASGLPFSACTDNALHYYYDAACFFIDEGLNPYMNFSEDKYDDVAISVFTVASNNVSDRWPQGGDTDGVWSLYNDNWTKDCRTGDPVTTEPFFTDDDIEAMFQTNAPAERGIVAVEVYICYSQILQLPIIADIVPDPFRLHAYTIMPAPEAIPTPTPIPTATPTPDP